jgi:hypothetical protein
VLQDSLALRAERAREARFEISRWRGSAQGGVLHLVLQARVKTGTLSTRFARAEVILHLEHLIRRKLSVEERVG